MCLERQHDWDAPDYIENGHLEDDSSSSENVVNASKYVLSNSGSSISVLNSTQKQKDMGMKNQILNAPSVKPI